MTDVEAALNEAFVKVFGNKYRLADKPAPSAPVRKRDVSAAKHPKKLEIGSRAWRDAVALKLVDGYGAEDIALWLGCHLSHVRAEVQRLRNRGTLADWWGRA